MGAVAAVTVGPYPVSMVHFPGLGELSPTHPPSPALLLFDGASSATALAAATPVRPWTPHDRFGIRSASVPGGNVEP